MELTERTAQEALKAIFKKASRILVSAQNLSAIRAIKEAAGMDLPKHINLKFVEPGSGPVHYPAV